MLLLAACQTLLTQQQQQQQQQPQALRQHGSCRQTRQAATGPLRRLLQQQHWQQLRSSCWLAGCLRRAARSSSRALLRCTRAA
jgi:hypothetical protein